VFPVFSRNGWNGRHGRLGKFVYIFPLPAFARRPPVVRGQRRAGIRERIIVQSRRVARQRYVAQDIKNLVLQFQPDVLRRVGEGVLSWTSIHICFSCVCLGLMKSMKGRGAPGAGAHQHDHEHGEESDSDDEGSDLCRHTSHGKGWDSANCFG
jgi:hypothetical protein